MKKIYVNTIFIFLLFASLFWGCTSKVSRNDMDDALGLLNVNPDSAVNLLATIDRNKLDDPGKAYWALLYTIALDKSGPDVDNDSLIRIAYDYYKCQAKDSMYAKCMYYMGKYYMLNDSTKQGLQCLEWAASASGKRGDLYTQYLAYYQLSRGLRISDPSQSLAYARKSLDLYEQMNQDKTSNLVYLIKEIGVCYDYLEKYDSAMAYMRKALSVAFKQGDNNLVGNTYHDLSTIYLRIDQPDSALYYAKQSWNLVNRKSPSLYTHLANCYMKMDSLDQAEKMLQEVLDMQTIPETRYNVYNRLLKISLQKSGISEALAYSDSAQSILGQLYISSETDNGSYKKDNQLLEEQKDVIRTAYKRNRIFTFFIILILLLLILLVWNNYYKSRKISQLKLEQEKEKYKRDMQQSMFEREKQKILLENKGKQLELLKSFYLSKANYAKQLQDLKQELNINDLSEVDWQEMELFLNELFFDFMVHFRKRHPQLNEKEYRNCMLLKMGLTNQELKRFYGIELQSVKQRLLKLKHKLAIDNDLFSAREYIDSFFENGEEKTKKDTGAELE